MNIDDKVYIIDNKEFVKYPESKNGCCYGCYFYREVGCYLTIKSYNIDDFCSAGSILVPRAGRISIEVVRSKLCNNDICPYYKENLSCESLNTCLYKLFKQNDRR